MKLRSKEFLTISIVAVLLWFLFGLGSYFFFSSCDNTIILKTWSITIIEHVDDDNNNEPVNNNNNNEVPVLFGIESLDGLCLDGTAEGFGLPFPYKGSYSFGRSYLWPIGIFANLIFYFILVLIISLVIKAIIRVKNLLIKKKN